MLKTLYVKNFAIIEDLKVEFDDLMTVLTGETGAGKSLIIDTISLLLGSRASKDMIRYKESKATIEGVFDYQNKQLDDLLNNLSIPILDTITIKREIGSKNTIKVNDVSINQNTLKNIGFYLADIHVQHDTFKLINPDTYLSLIDDFTDMAFSDIYNKYQIDYANYINSKNKYNDVLNSKDKSVKELDFLTFQLNEINSISPKKDEDINLENQIDLLKNYDKIFSNLSEAHASLDNEYFSIDNIYNAKNNLDKISSFNKSYEEYAEMLDNAFYILQDVVNEISGEISNLEYDTEQLDSMQQRLSSINNLKSKYKLSLNEIITLKEEISEKISLVTDYDNVIKTTYNKLVVNYEKLVKSSMSLTNYRKKVSLEIEKHIIKECKDLDLEDISFNISFKDVEFKDCLKNDIFTNNGVDEIDFMISLNKGEPQKSLHTTASGGELSRIMLAFKAYFIKKTNLSLIIFDEIDSGVSGEAAQKIALKMKQISKTTQVLCITHLPAVAAISDNHIYIYKEYINDRTSTNIKKLDKEERITKIAYMISGNTLSKYAIEHASYLLENN